MAEITYPSKLTTVINNVCGGDGILVEMNKSGTTGKIWARNNAFKVGKFKYNWQAIYEKYKEYINTSVYKIDELNNIEWTLTGWESILAPKYIHYDSTANPKIFEPVIAEPVIYVPANIICTVVNVLSAAIDLTSLLGNYSKHELINDLIKYMPNTVVDGKFVVYYSSSDTNSEYYYSDSEAIIGIVNYYNKYYSNLMDDLSSPRDDGISLLGSVINATTALIPSGITMYYDGYGDIYLME